MSAEIWSIVLLSLKVSAFALIWAVPIAFGLAYLLARKQFWGKQLLSAVIMLPLVMPPVVTGLVLLYVFGPLGPVGLVLAPLGVSFAFNAAGASLAAGLVALPLIVRPIRLSLEAVDPNLDEALAVAGRSRLQRFSMLYLPMALPGVVAGGILGFAKAMGEFGATITFVANIPGETQTFSLAIHSALQKFDGGETVLLLSIVSILISVIAVLGSEYLLNWLQKRMLGEQVVRHA
ncbi:molybdate ABC transporter permease subunit [Maritalea porphyrae]|uniref:Molybdenum transport system permease n=1 Tax=Maritalea porphyrae TaxID=880732 RepID=A0ABQ5UNE3_9HYPH|nr:molybdate ABC transporter permease subunit [Maritalea porphyrae]GLQ16359.1 molybdate ABC transporter permease [Maritalea porphyrae]